MPWNENDETEMSVSVVDRTVTPPRTVDSKVAGVFGWLTLTGMTVPLVVALKLVDTLRSGTDR